MNYHLLIIKVLLAATLPLWIAGCKKKASFDLAAELVSIAPLSPQPGDPVVFTYRVRNVGVTNAPPKSYSIELSVDGSVIAFDRNGNHHTLEPGKHVEYSMAPGFCHFVPEKKGMVSFMIAIKSRWGGVDVNDVNDQIKGNFRVN